jgi:hypothetical protein
MQSISVGAARFELATSWSQTRRDDRTTLRPEQFLLKNLFLSMNVFENGDAKVINTISFTTIYLNKK